MMDDFNKEPGTTVAIPRPRWKIVTNLMATSLIAGLAAMIIWINLHLDPAQAARPQLADRWFKAAFAVVAALVALRNIGLGPIPGIRGRGGRNSASDLADARWGRQSGVCIILVRIVPYLAAPPGGSYPWKSGNP